MKKIKVNRKFIAQKANVSTATVSYVLNDIPNSRVGKKTKKRVMEIAKKYDYFPNILARSLVMQKTFNIGFINTLPLVTFLGDSFQNSIFAGIESAIEKNGYSLLFSLLKYTDDIKDLNFSVKKMICGNIVDGIVLYGKVEPNLIEFLYQNNVQFILIDYFIDNIKTNSILPDNINGAFEATEHLIKQNLKNIYCINGKEKHPSYTERPAGYRKAMKKARLKPKVLNIGTRIEEAYIFTKKLIEKKDMPEAFFATGD
ncbi:MAG: LacI family DNA-binding transcriptional regulator, partial [Methanosarcinaceae archaeon]